MFVTEGRGRMNVAGKDFELGAGDFLLVPANRRQEYSQLGEARWCFFWFHLEPKTPWLQVPLEIPMQGRSDDMNFLKSSMFGFFIEVISTLQTIPGDLRRMLRFYQDSLPLSDTLNAFRLKMTHSHFYSDELADLHADTIVTYLKREIKSLLLRLDEDESHNRLEKLLGILAGRLDFPWDLKQMAVLVNMSVPTLIRHSRKAYPSTLMQILYAMRMKYAAQLLLSSERPVAEIAARVGYKNTTSFSTAFRKEFHLSPREYRNRNRHEKVAQLPFVRYEAILSE
ncbi:HTH-type transcriptional activator RhaR [bioreactor metagenome]|uniref:HTH-type transcriptional activator RhaR n=1 Tax=bioreactor metagenome TaxID=1076179 RepID=A0A645DYQ7_9ZZZZ